MLLKLQRKKGNKIGKTFIFTCSYFLINFYLKPQSNTFHSKYFIISNSQNSMQPQGHNSMESPANLLQQQHNYDVQVGFAFNSFLMFQHSFRRNFIQTFLLQYKKSLSLYLAVYVTNRRLTFTF